MDKFKKYSDKIVKGSFIFIILSGIAFNIYFWLKGDDPVGLEIIAITCVFLLAYIYSEKFFKEKLFFIPATFFYIAIIFTFFSSYLGSFLNFYERFEIWDDILHFVSGILLGILCIILTSFVIVKNFGEINKKSVILFLVVVGVMVSISIAVFWEFYEFAFDYLFDGNMQRSVIISNPETFDPSPYMRPSGRFMDPGLLDTMGDFLQAVLGAILAGIYCFIHYSVIVEHIEEYDYKQLEAGSMDE